MLLSKEEVVAIPTETVYGLAGNIFSEAAIRRIFEVKGRPMFNPLIVHLHSIDQVSEIALEFPDKARKLAQAFWPGPLTLVLKKRDVIPNLITAGKDTVAVRIPQHPVTLKLLQQLTFPLAAPSANPSNRISPTSASHVEEYFAGKIPMILEGGACTKGIESTIVAFEHEEVKILRLGSISQEDIEQVVGPIVIRNKSQDSPDAPGMLKKHYSPTTSTILVSNVTDFKAEKEGERVGLLSFTGADIPPGFDNIKVLSTEGDLEEASSNLYQSLHQLDSLNLDLIVLERLPDTGLGRSINDRLERAANK